MFWKGKGMSNSSNSKSVKTTNSEKDSQITNKADDNLLFDTVKKMAMAPEKNQTSC